MWDGVNDIKINRILQVSFQFRNESWQKYATLPLDGIFYAVAAVNSDVKQGLRVEENVSLILVIILGEY